MQDIFITKIQIKEVRNVKDFEINLSETERKHLIITGKNGSGKTSLLEGLKKFLNRLVIPGDNYELYERNESYLLSLYEQKMDSNISNFAPEQLERMITDTKNLLDQFGGTKILFNTSQIPGQNTPLIQREFEKGEFIIKFFEAKRRTQFAEPKGPRKFEFKTQYQIDDYAGNQFTQHLVNLQFDKLVAKDENDSEGVKKIDEWFETFEKDLGNLFSQPDFKLAFDKKDYRFQILENGNPPYTFNQLPDGYSAILDIVTELIMRMEEHKTKSYDVQGIVLIDEIETHLHVDLQKKILPFLTSFFPKIQFIVTTHSPFVLSSIENAVICDLEKRIVTEDLSGYSYDTIVESYFDSDNYSAEFAEKLAEYEDLMNRERKNLTGEERDRLNELEIYLDSLPKYWAKEFAVKYQQIRLNHIGKEK